MKHYFLGLAGNYTRERRLKHTFSIGRKRDLMELEKFLEKKYEGKAILCKNGRSALALALKSYFNKLGFGTTTGIELPSESRGKISFNYETELISECSQVYYSSQTRSQSPTHSP